MRSYDAATAAQLTARGDLEARRLVWIKARNKSTAQVEALGLWDGDYSLAITLEGEARSYLDVGALLQSDPITAGPGLAVRTHRLHLSAIAPEVEDLVKGYDTRFAPVEIHRALLDPATRAVVGVPHRVFRGMINSLEFRTPEPGAAAVCDLDLVSETRALTRTLALKKSDMSHKRRGGDRFRRYGDVSGSVPIYWGELRSDPPGASKPAKPNSTGGAGGSNEVAGTDEWGNLIYKGR